LPPVVLFGANVAHGRTADEVNGRSGAGGAVGAGAVARIALHGVPEPVDRRSDAPLARDLRLLVRERIAAGATDTQVIDFLVARYGEFVLLKPRVEGHTLILWLVPPLALLGGGFALWFYNRRRAQAAVAAGEAAAFHLTPEEEARLAKLMDDEERAGKAG